jgi:hypothetical protein
VGVTVVDVYCGVLRAYDVFLCVEVRALDDSF